MFTDAVANGSNNDEDTVNPADSIGCTANVILIDKTNKKMYIANAGDSRSVLSRKGEAVELSIDHKPDNPEEKRRIEAAGSFVQDGRVDANLNLSRSLGDLKYKKNTSIS